MALFSKKKNDLPPDMGAQDQGFYGQNYPAYGEQPQYPQEQPQYPQEQPQYPQQQYPQQQEQPQSREMIQEIAEAIVEEKWKEKEKEQNRITEWRDDVTAKVAQLQQQIDDLKSSFESLHRGLLGKISEYDENLTNVGTEIKAMEQVFSKILPSLTESVNKLQRFSEPKKKV
ncbi:MAG TPA: hypothetical protein VFF28_08005 [Candidatus Nanoarchaeia archaeon]|nr:hypothetical protein [Candidatus Nanoarchaeia archaeon]